MRKIIFFAAALTVLAGAASCEKNIEPAQPQLQPSGELRQVTITAGSPKAKTSVSGGELTWSENDKLNIAPQSGTIAAAALSIKSGVGTVSGTFEGQVDASITDATELYGWCGGEWTYNAGTFSVDMPASQTYAPNGLAENAYPSIGTGSITSGITLSNPMGVLKLSVFGAMAGDKVKSITVTSAANNLAGEFSIDNSTNAVSGGSSKTVTLNIASPYAALSLTDSVNFYVVVPPATYAASDLSVTVTFSDDSYSINTFTDAVTVTAGSATAKEIIDHTGRRGLLNGQEYVLIRAKYDGTNDSYLKWATQNLAVTESGKQEWKPNGTGTGYIIGDYFQWAASYAGYGITADADKVPENLVIYTSFTNTCAGGKSDSFSFKTGKGFYSSYTPYYKGSRDSSCTKYTSTDGKTLLEQSDDVANIVLGSTWRIPTGGSAGEFKAMYAATRCQWHYTDIGLYVTKRSESLSSDKSNVLLFFPASGYGASYYFCELMNTGIYWSSTLSYYMGSAHRLSFDKSGGVLTDFYYNRYCGFPIRPVSD